MTTLEHHPRTALRPLTTFYCLKITMCVILAASQSLQRIMLVLTLFIRNWYRKSHRKYYFKSLKRLGRNYLTGPNWYIKFYGKLIASLNTQRVLQWKFNRSQVKLRFLDSLKWLCVLELKLQLKNVIQLGSLLSEDKLQAELLKDAWNTLENLFNWQRNHRWPLIDIIMQLCLTRRDQGSMFLEARAVKIKFLMLTNH